VTYTLTTAATEEPVTLDEAKAHLRIDHDDEDDHIAALITAARQWAEMYTRRQFISATYTLYLDWFPGEIVVPRPPLISVTSISYLDTAGASQTLATSVYAVDAVALPGRIRLKFNESWPGTRTIENAVTVVYIAGYGAATAVPETAKAALKLLVAHLYENREPYIVGTSVSALPMAAKSLLSAERVMEFS